MNTETIEIKKENVMAAYNAASDKIKNTLETLFGKETFKPKDVMERVKTFEDACKELGENHPYVLQYTFNYSDEGGWNDNADTRDFAAYLKLRIIAAALNEGWEPQFTEDEWRYYPWFVLYTQKGIDEMDEEQKSRVVFRSLSNANAVGGVAYANTINVSSDTYASLGSRLAFKSEELARYAGKQFFEIWANYVFKAE